jgi:acetyltransferase-like isoleucine patch superfamily enzyme
MLRRLKRLLLEPGATLAGLLDYYVYPRIVARNAGLTLRGRLFVRGMPRVRIGDGASVTIGDNVTLNSQDRGYHLNIFAPMKIMADRPGAEIVIGDNTRMTGTCIHAYLRITIGKNCLIAANTQIFDGSAHDLCFPNVEDRIHTVGGAKEIVIEDNVWIGANSIVLPGVTWWRPAASSRRAYRPTRWRGETRRASSATSLPRASKGSLPDRFRNDDPLRSRRRNRARLGGSSSGRRRRRGVALHR